MTTTTLRAVSAAVLPCLLLIGCNGIETSARPDLTTTEATSAGAERSGASATSPRSPASPRPSLTGGHHAGTGELKAIVRRHAEANGVPFSLAHAVVMVESRYRPQATNAGNFGLMQIRLQTARGVGYQGDARGLLNPDTNARYAMKYLAQAYRLAGGDTCRTIMKYQSGHMAIRMNGANRAYCGKVRTLMAQA